MCLTNNYAFLKIFKKEENVKGFLIDLLNLKEKQIKKIEIKDPFTSGENKEEKEGILDIKLTLNGNKKINIEMQNTYQEDWTERSLFYNCRMFTEGFKKGEPYWKLSPCIHVGILNFNMMKSPGYYHKVTLRDEKTNELYSRKFQFHMIELKKTKTAKGKARKHPLYRWARLIAATTWEEVAQESAGNRYMERIQEEMVKMSQDERDRYLYLREEMAASDRVSQLQSAENRGVRAGKLLNQISMIQKKVKKNKNLEQIADELEESATKIRPIYDQVKQHPDKTAEEIYNLINNE
ncbi:Rpn family recombination-promoting nuclease/putative transposase [Anaerostipes hadrus]|nr:Rpn family recombination-promoting nuclease/putative transposase [Anaerostipes hadrus]NSG70306.1 Rpn family recombination-promoting nuclease/putative transposase [Anaerostipes hadrus]